MIRVNELSGQPGRPAAGAIGPVGGDRVADVAEVDAQLVGTAGAEERVDEGEAAKALDYSEAGLGGSTALAHGHALSVARVAADRSVDEALALREVTKDEQEIALDRLVGLHLAL